MGLRRLVSFILTIFLLLSVNSNYAIANNKVIDLSATINKTQVVLKWNKCPNAVKYTVKISSNNRINTINTTKTSYTDNKINASGNFGYQVYAYSKENRVINRSKLIVLNLDFDIIFEKPKNFKINNIDYNSVYLHWDKVNGANSYKVYRKSSSEYKLIASVKNTYFQDDSLIPSVKYQYKVVPKLVIGNLTYNGEASSTKSIKTKLNTPKIDKSSSKGYNYIKFSYSKVKGASGYSLFYKVAGGNWKKYKSTKSLTIKCNGLKLNKTYYFKIRAYKKVSGKYYHSDYSTTKSYTPKLDKPKFVINEKTKYEKINISKVLGASGYKIYTSTSPNGTYKCIKTIKSNKNLTYKFYPKTSKRYYIKVKAYKTQSGKKIYSKYSKRISYKLKK